MEKNHFNKFWVGYGVATVAITASRLIFGSGGGEVNPEDIQRHNSQIEQVVSDRLEAPEDLILDGKDKTFEFTISQEGQPEQSCSGEYTVTEDVASITGEIACTTTIQIGN